MHLPLLLLRYRRLWDQFCEYTELPGFRFMTTKVTMMIRLAAICTFVCSLLGMSAQLVYLVNQYMRSQIQTSSRKYRLERQALPIVYLCHPLNGTHPLALLDLCRTYVFEHNSPDMAQMETMQSVIPFCVYQIKLVLFRCELRCKWTSQGFCVEARLNVSSGISNSTQLDFVASNDSATMNNNMTGNSGESLDRQLEEAEADNDFHEVSTYDIRIHFNSSLSRDASPDTLALGLVFLRFSGDAQKWASSIPLVGAAHMIMERDSQNSIQVIEILKIIKTDVPDTQLVSLNSSYERCVWETNSRLMANWSCPSEFITNLFAQTDADFANVTYKVSECAFQRAIAAKEHCPEDKVFNRFTVESAIFTRPEVDFNGVVAGKANDLDWIASNPNLRIYPNDVVMQETLHQLRSVEWKMLSEIGGTLALYLGFTLMSLLEAVVFIAVDRVRKVAQQMDEESQMARKNPPIKNMRQILRKVLLLTRTLRLFSNGTKGRK